MHTHYDNLKVARGAPAEVIKAAYRALSQRYHPDRNPGPEAERVMRLLNEAYAMLGDPERRAAYDRELAVSENEPSNHAFADADKPAAAPWTAGGAGAGASAMSGFAATVAAAYAARAPIAPALGAAVARCFARLFDVGWEEALLGVGAAFFLRVHWHAFSVWVSEPGNPLLFAVLCLPAAMLLDALVYRVAGNTPGKALLGLKVTTPDGGPLPWKTYLRRNLAVWARGLGCGIPFVNVVTMWRRGREAAGAADVVYDAKTGHQVSAAEIGVARKAMFGVLCAALFAAAPAISTVTSEQEIDRPLPPPPIAAVPVPPPAAKKAAAKPLRDSPWTNPLTGNRATVDGLWRVSSTVSPDQQTVYSSFTARDGRTTVMFAAQDMPNLPMGDFVLAYLRDTASMMNLSPPDSVDHAGITDTWVADGHLNTDPAVAVHVELRHLGESYWRMVVLRSPHAHVGDEVVGQLVQRLWATVPGV
jgi:hypothetical protein